MRKRESEEILRENLADLQSLNEEDEEYIIRKSFRKKRHGKQRRSRDRKIQDDDYYG